jgi:hypothetical protein
MAERWKLEWVDRGVEPQCAPDPDYPNGKDVDFSKWCVDGWPTCRLDLPYPAKRCGAYLIECLACGMTVAVTTAGRADDPRSVTVGCKRTPRKELH